MDESWKYLSEVVYMCVRTDGFVICSLTFQDS